MKNIYFVVLVALIQACASTPSPYITDCDQPECELQAVEKPLVKTSADGIRVIVNTSVSFYIDRTPEDLIHQEDMLIIIFPDDTKIASSTLSLNDFGLESSEIFAHSLLNLSFMEKFSLLPRSLSRAERHVIRSIKIDSMSSGEAVRYANDKITVYFYSESDVRHKAYVVSDQDTSSWIMLDFFGLKVDRVKKLISTIDPF